MMRMAQMAAGDSAHRSTRIEGYFLSRRLWCSCGPSGRGLVMGGQSAIHFWFQTAIEFRTSSYMVMTTLPGCHLPESPPTPYARIFPRSFDHSVVDRDVSR